VGRGVAVNLNYMCLSHVPDPSSLLREEGCGEDGINVMPGEAIRLDQILKFFNMRVRFTDKVTKAFFNLRQVCERKGNMNLHNTLGASHFSE
jgi:hypothetical protein